MLLIRVLLGALVIASRLESCHPTFSFVTGTSDEYQHRYLVQVGCCHLQLMRGSFIVDVVSASRTSCLWLDWLLYLAGDVALNPGPVRFPCTVCNHPVLINQRAIQCDQCQNWTHANCAHVSKSLYDQLSVQVESSWHYPSCLFLELPAVSVFDVSTLSDTESPTSPSVTFPIVSDVLSDSFSGVQVIHYNIQGLLSKTTDVCELLGSCVATASVFLFY